jgi:hypothetical protein
MPMPFAAASCIMGHASGFAPTAPGFAPGKAGFVISRLPALPTLSDNSTHLSKKEMQ